MLDLQVLDAAMGGLFGLLIGSFLNVVIHRLPKMMERQWAQECAELSGQEPEDEPSPYNLLTPASTCPHCGHRIRWFENIPVISYAVLRGRCSACNHGISLRYPLVELVTAALFAACVWRWGWTMQGALWSLFCATLLVLALIDWDTTLLPDSLTQPLLWSGLIASALHLIPVGLPDALWGAVAGYLSLWLIFWSFKLATGKEGMGFGDFKLFAALGAWYGWTALIPILLLASVVGAVIGVGLKLARRLDQGYLPFGPFLVGAGLLTLWLGPAQLLRWIGLLPF